MTDTPTLADRVAAAREALAEYDAHDVCEKTVGAYGANCTLPVTHRGPCQTTATWMAEHLRAALDALSAAAAERDALRVGRRADYEAGALAMRYRAVTECRVTMLAWAEDRQAAEASPEIDECEALYCEGGAEAAAQCEQSVGGIDPATLEHIDAALAATERDDAR